MSIHDGRRDGMQTPCDATYLRHELCTFFACGLATNGDNHGTNPLFMVWALKPVQILRNKKAEVVFLCFPSTLVVFVAQPKKAHHHAGGLNQ